MRTTSGREHRLRAEVRRVALLPDGTDTREAKRVCAEVYCEVHPKGLYERALHVTLGWIAHMPDSATLKVIKMQASWVLDVLDSLERRRLEFWVTCLERRLTETVVTERVT